MDENTTGDTIIFRGEHYISSRRAAEISGYTPDYIGQMARNKEVPSVVIGRTRFVEEAALRSLLADKGVQGHKTKDVMPPSSGFIGRFGALTTALLLAGGIFFFAGGAEAFQSIAQNIIRGTLAFSETVSSGTARFTRALIAPVSKKVFESRGSTHASEHTQDIPNMSPRQEDVPHFASGATIGEYVFVDRIAHIGAVFGAAFASATESVFGEVVNRTTYLTKTLAHFGGAIGKTSAQVSTVAGVSLVETVRDAAPVIAAFPHAVGDGGERMLRSSVVTVARTLESVGGGVGYALAGIGTTIRDTINTISISTFNNLQALFYFGDDEDETPGAVSDEDDAVESEQVLVVQGTQEAIATNIPQRVVERVERVIERTPTTAGNVSHEALQSALANVYRDMRAYVDGIRGGTSNSNSIQTVFNAIAHTNSIDQLDSVTISSPTITGGSLANVTFSGTVTGLTDDHIPSSLTLTTLSVSASTTFNGVEYLFPSADGTNGQVLSTNASGGLSWTTVAGGSVWEAFSNNLGIRLVDATDVVLIGGSSTTTDAVLEVAGDVHLNGQVGISTTTPWGKLAVTNAFNTPSFVVADATSDATPFVIDADGNVGVGTTTPWGRLSVLALSSNTKPLFSISTSTATATSTAFHIDSSGRVGIGTSTPSEDLAVAGRLYVGGAGTSTVEENLIVRGNLQVGAGSVVITESNFTATNDFTISTATEANHLTLQSFGRVGVASSTPWGVLSIEHNGANADRPVFVAADTGTSSALFILDYLGNVGIGTSSPYASLSVVGPVVAEYFHATSTTASSTLLGAVGVGTTSPAQQLAVAGRLYVGGAGTSTVENNFHVLGNLQVGAGSVTITESTLNTSDSFTISTTNEANHISLQSFGRVGVASSTPWGVLSVEHNGANAGRPVFVASDQGTTSPLFILDHLGNVGIGTSSPYAKLSVSGQVVAASFSATTTATSTFSGGLDVLAINQTGSASSTFANGINLAAGCFAVNGTCVSGGASAYTGLSDTQASFTANRIIHTNSGATALADTAGFVFDGTNLGVGTTTPYASLSVVGPVVAEYFHATSTTQASTFGHSVVATNGTREARLSASFDGSGTMGVGGFTSHDFTFYQNSAEVFRLTSGSVVVNGTSAGAGFDVHDTAWLRGTPSGTSGLYVNNSGLVAVGHQSPIARFHVVGNGTVAALFETGNIGIGTISATSTLTVFGGAQVCTNADGSCPASNTDGDIYATTRSGGAIDVAEWIKVAPSGIDAEGNATVSAGSLVCVAPETPGAVVACGTPEAGTFIGVVSTKPHLTMGSEFAGPDAVRLALAGRVPVRVHSGGGAIVPGDRIALSSEIGIGKRGELGEGSVAIALEPFDGSGVGSILAFVENDRRDDIASLAERVDALEERVTALEGQRGSGGGGDVLAVLQSLGTRISNELASFAAVVAERLTIGSAENPTGITLYDEETGEPYCLSVRGGTSQTQAGACGGQSAANNEQQTTEGHNIGEVPTITIYGNNPAEVPLHADFVDPGAQANDTEDGVRFVDVEGDEDVDTSVVGEYEIVYTASDTDGNHVVAVRTVIVYDPNAPEQTSEPNGEDESNGDGSATSTPPVAEEEETTDVTENGEDGGDGETQEENSTTTPPVSEPEPEPGSDPESEPTEDSSGTTTPPVN